MAKVYANANRAAARHVDARKAVRKERDQVTRAARTNLERANTTRRVTKKGYFPAEILESEEVVDDHELCYTILQAPNAMALEFGHAPSGYFDPDLPYLPGNNSRAPSPTYILSRAAIRGSVS